eukprot:348402-Amphidinium_carterae.3
MDFHTNWNHEQCKKVLVFFPRTSRESKTCTKLVSKYANGANLLVVGCHRSSAHQPNHEPMAANTPGSSRGS